MLACSDVPASGACWCRAKKKRINMLTCARGERAPASQATLAGDRDVKDGNACSCSSNYKEAREPKSRTPIARMENSCDSCGGTRRLWPCSIPWHVRPRAKDRERRRAQDRWEWFDADLCTACLDRLPEEHCPRLAPGRSAGPPGPSANGCYVVGWDWWDAADGLESLLRSEPLHMPSCRRALGAEISRL